MTAKHPSTPCADCPYRKDSPRKLWSREEFVDLLAKDAAEGMDGAVYACHKHAKLDPKDRGWCAGWALDQQRRGVPSIPLRLLLMRNESAQLAWAGLTDAGLPMFGTIQQMARANGVRPKTGGDHENHAHQDGSRLHRIARKARGNG